MGLIVQGVIFFACLIAMSVITVVTYFHFIQPRTPIQLEYESESLKGGARIYKDSLGVSHIFAENEEAMLFAQGYVMAKDRSFQMLKMRALA